MHIRNSTLLFALVAIALISSGANAIRIAPKAEPKTIMYTLAQAGDGNTTYYIYYSYADRVLIQAQTVDYDVAINFYNSIQVYDYLTNKNTSAAYAKIITDGFKTLNSSSANVQNKSTNDAYALQGYASLHSGLDLKYNTLFTYSAANSPDSPITTRTYTTLDEATNAIKTDPTQFIIVYQNGNLMA